MFHNIMLVLPYFIGGAIILGVIFGIALVLARRVFPEDFECEKPDTETERERQALEDAINWE